MNISIANLFFVFISIQLLINIAPNFIQIHLTADALIAESVELLKGRVIRAVVVQYAPSFMITKKSDGTSEYSGTTFESLNDIAKVLQLNIEYVVATQEELKALGLSQLEIEALINDVADVGPIGLVANPDKYKQVDISVPKMIEPYIIIVPWPKEESRLLASIRPFQPMVWIWLGATILILIPFLTFLSGFYQRYVTRNSGNSSIGGPIIGFYGLLHNASFLLSHITNQGYHYNLRFRSRGSFVIVGIWCLMAVVLANAYGGVLFSFLSVSKLEPVINSLEELAKSEHVKLMIQARTELTIRFLNATTGCEKLIGDSLRAHPDNMVPSPKAAETKLMQGSHAFTYFKLFSYGLIDSTYRKNGKKCRLTIAKVPISVFSPVCMALQKNSPFTKGFNEQIQAQIEAGLIDLYYSKATPRVDQCRLENQKGSARQKSLNLYDMSTAFVILGLGISLAVLVFLLELIYKRIMDHYYIQRN